jgi:nucleotide-binding universal stress UspA family protein
METQKNIILVPYDFTPVADNAVKHAIKFCNKLNADLCLLHIVKKEPQIEEYEGKLKDAAEKIYSDNGIRPSTIVRFGTIFKTINEVIDELDSILVVMGTHGMKGLQKLTGSWALKVIVGSKIPYLVIQEPPNNEDELKIVYPVDYKSENKESLKWVDFLSQIFKVKTYLFALASKGGNVDSRTKANLVFNKKFLEDKGIDYEIAMAQSKTSFPQEIIRYAEDINADVILVMTTRDIAFHDYILGANE